MTAHYNGYYNATVLLAEAQRPTWTTQVQDNYRKVLPVYKYVGRREPQGRGGEDGQGRRQGLRGGEHAP
jgi:hypothetical protein